MTTQTATGLRGICGNDGLKKCWKSNITERKRLKRTENIIKKFKFRLTCRGSQVRVLYRPPDRKSLKPLGFRLFCYFDERHGTPTDRKYPKSYEKRPMLHFFGTRRFFMRWWGATGRRCSSACILTLPILWQVTEVETEPFKALPNPLLELLFHLVNKDTSSWSGIAPKKTKRSGVS